MPSAGVRRETSSMNEKRTLSQVVEAIESLKLSPMPDEARLQVLICLTAELGRRLLEMEVKPA